MVRKHRPPRFRQASHRVERWDKKMDASVYAVYLERTKDLARREFAAYQVKHERLLSIVRSAIEKYPSEYPRLHAYVWYAQGVWYAVNKYTGLARQRLADATFVYWFMQGLDEWCLRDIARKLGVEISWWSDLYSRYGLPGIARLITTYHVRNDLAPVPYASPKLHQVAAPDRGFFAIAYLEGIRVVAENPAGSGTPLRFRVACLLDDGSEAHLWPLGSDWHEVEEGEKFDDWLRWPYDALPSGRAVKEVRLYAYCAKPPARGLEPRLALREVVGLEQ